MVETLDLQDEIGSLGATNVEVPPPPPDVAPDPPKEPEKNISTSQKIDMDSTPISDIMGQPQDVPMMQEQMPLQAPPMQQAQVAQVQQAQPAVPMKSKNMFNLTDEQMEALTAAVVALIAFAGPVQDKLAGVVPSFTTEGGARSMTGMLVTGVLVAILFFFSRRFMNKA